MLLGEGKIAVQYEMILLYSTYSYKERSLHALSILPGRIVEALVSIGASVGGVVQPNFL